MERQDWQDKELDKDILAEGNKIYSPKTSVFVDGSVNKFINDSGASRGKYMIGVARRKETHSFAAMCHNGFTGKLENIGYFKTEIDAHNAWKKRKHELACQLADLQTDQRVADALRVRYL
jgi:hypothetical protein